LNESYEGAEHVENTARKSNGTNSNFINQISD